MIARGEEGYAWTGMSHISSLGLAFFLAKRGRARLPSFCVQFRVVGEDMPSFFCCRHVLGGADVGFCKDSELRGYKFY